MPGPYRTYKLPINFGGVHITVSFTLPRRLTFRIVFFLALRTIGWSDIVGMSLGVHTVDDPLLMEEVRIVSNLMILAAREILTDTNA